ncbi:MAG TPA: DUF2784 domain-containing protein [Gemmatimonadaceae bacterium]
MTWRLLARAVAAVHVAYVVFVLVGSVLALKWPQLMWVHLAAVTWAGLTLIFDLGCPLTPWEKRFWKLGGVEPYPEGFLQHHILKTRFAPGKERRNHAILGTAAVLLNVILYVTILRQGR